VTYGQPPAGAPGEIILKWALKNNAPVMAAITRKSSIGGGSIRYNLNPSPFSIFHVT